MECRGVSIRLGMKVRLNKATLPASLSGLFGTETFTLVGEVRRVSGGVVVVDWPRPYDQATYLELDNVVVVDGSCPSR